ncbi:MAG: AtpZ/AtpI family protein [Helicobacter sp.]|nr:AtpZ/AtpI family protein [Helicobacter sp.]
MKPEKELKQEKKEEKEELKEKEEPKYSKIIQGATALSLGISIVVALLIGVLIGIGLVKLFGHKWLIFIGLFLGLGAAISNVIKAYKKQKDLLDS